MKQERSITFFTEKHNACKLFCTDLLDAYKVAHCPIATETEANCDGRLVNLMKTEAADLPCFKTSLAYFLDCFFLNITTSKSHYPTTQ